MTERSETYETERGDRPPLGTPCVLYPAWVTASKACDSFREKHGYYPEWLKVTGGGILAGPVRRGEE